MHLTLKNITAIDIACKSGEVENRRRGGPPWGTRSGVGWPWPLLWRPQGPMTGLAYATACPERSLLQLCRLRLSHSRDPHIANTMCVVLDLDCSRADSTGEKDRVDGPASQSAGSPHNHCSRALNRLCLSWQLRLMVLSSVHFSSSRLCCCAFGICYQLCCSC